MPTTFKTAAQRRKLDAETVTMADLRSRATAAARMMMTSRDRFSDDDRADAASDAIWRTLESLPMPTDGRTGAPRDVLAWIDGGYRQALQRTDRVPADLASFARLCHLASNYRRGLERQRDRDTADALRRAAEGDTFTPHLEMPADETGGTPWGARRSAVDMLRAIGALDRVVHHGPVWTLAYTAARAVQADGAIDRDAVAAELELTPDTLRQHLSRAVARIPAAKTHTRPQWADALNLPVGGVALKPSRSRTLSADMGTRENGPTDHLARKDHAPVTVRTDKRIRRTRPRLSDWAKDLQHGTPAQRRTADRLATAADMRGKRANARTAAERDTLRAAALAR